MTYTTTIPKTSNSVFKIIAASTIGNALEWYDILIYAAMAPIISKLFFPAGSDTVSLLLTLGTFGVSYFMRPLGALVLGAYADRRGRKAALSATLLLMTLGTFLLGVMPTYAEVGLLGPFGIVAARMIQGFSSGGEFGSSTALLAEQDPARRGALSSWQPASQGLSVLFAGLFSYAVNTILDAAQLESWGWRLPFLFGVLVGPVGVYIRQRIDESPEFASSVHESSPIAGVFIAQKRHLLICAGLVVLSTILIYLSVYMPTYAIRQLDMPVSASFFGPVITGLFLFVLSPLIGRLSDRIGRTTPMLIAVALAILLAYPMFAVLVRAPTFATMVCVQATIGALLSLYFAPMPALMAEIFPVATRTTGLSFSYSVGVTIFGGFAPFIITSLLSITEILVSPSFYLIFGAALSMVAILAARREFGVR